MKKATLYFDGSAQPKNPGECCSGAVLLIDDVEHIFSQNIGSGSNNTAEYNGLILGLNHALRLGVDEIEIFGDSQLVIKCVTGEWGSKQAHLTICIQYVRQLLSQFDSWSIEWISGDDNPADSPSRKAIGSHQSVQKVVETDMLKFEKGVALKNPLVSSIDRIKKKKV